MYTLNGLTTTTVSNLAVGAPILKRLKCFACTLVYSY